MKRSNSRPSPWQGDALPLSYIRNLSAGTKSPSEPACNTEGPLVKLAGKRAMKVTIIVGNRCGDKEVTALGQGQRNGGGLVEGVLEQ